MKRAPSSKGRTRAVRILVLVAANAACLFVVWKVALAARGDASTRARDSSAPVATNAPVLAAASNVPVRERDSRLEARIQACIATGKRDAVTTSKGKVTAGACAVSVHVREQGASGELVAVDADRPMRPASNLKLVTTAAALVLLGPDGAFDTVFESAARIENGVLQGDLVVHASGDPLYDRDAQGDVSRFLDPVATQLKAEGVTRIAGAVVLDEGTYAPPSPGPAWPAENQHWQEFCALAGGFSANAGCLTTAVRATAPGRAAEVDVRPHGHGLTPRFDVKTGAARTALDVRIAAVGGIARVDGSIPKDVPAWEGRVAAPDPVQLFAGALDDALARGGIRVENATKREHRGLDPASRVLARIETPVLEVLPAINTWSNNATADQLFLFMGQSQMGSGTRAGGRAATAHALELLGVDAQALVQVDGSGLSRDNRVSARQITALVDAVLRRDARSARAFRDSLAVGGETGTLDKRLGALEGRVHAKTGFIGGTSALSGLLETTDGHTLVFSILVEYPNVDGLNRNCWKPMQDAICEVLAGASG